MCECVLNGFDPDLHNCCCSSGVLVVCILARISVRDYCICFAHFHVLCAQGVLPDSHYITLCYSSIHVFYPLRRAYYLSKHTGRRLTWYTGKGTADIRARIGPSSRGHEITVSTYQMCIMMLFNGPPAQLQLHSSSMAVESEEAVAQLQLASEAPVVVSFRDMRVALGPDVPVDELKRHVLSLSVPKMKVRRLFMCASTERVRERERESGSLQYVQYSLRLRCCLIVNLPLFARMHTMGLPMVLVSSVPPSVPADLAEIQCEEQGHR